MHIINSELFRKLGPSAIPILVVVIIALAEFLIMLIMPHIPGVPDSGYGEALVDSLLLASIAGPILWKLLVDPLRKAAQTEITEAAVVLGVIPEGIITVNSSGKVTECNHSAESLLDYNASDWYGKSLDSIFPGLASVDSEPSSLDTQKPSVNSITLSRGDRSRELSYTRTSWKVGSKRYTTYVLRDITEQLRIEQQLRSAQKLESIGQLAAGIAHEINTPTQYVGDNTRFLQDAFTDIMSLVNELSSLPDSKADSELAASIAAAFERADVEHLNEEILSAIEQSLEGIERITNIVRAMKEFSHPVSDMTVTDLNKAIQNTLTVATNEWRYVANIRTDFDPELPLVMCLPGEFNQTMLNIIVNAAHAVADVVAEDHKGIISISTRNLGDWVEIRVSDTGCGMTDEVRNRIFDPFFTTKEVGKGTGQGLSMAYNIIVEKHDGSIEVESEPGKGTSFVIRLPAGGIVQESIAV